jgi:hypothetical protein
MKDQRHLFCLALFAPNLSGCDRPGAYVVPLTSGRVPPILLFNGTGTSPNDVAAIETLLEKSQISYSTATSAQLDEMSAARLRTYHLVIVPGGDFTRIGMVLSSPVGVLGSVGTPMARPPWCKGNLGTDGSSSPGSIPRRRRAGVVAWTSPRRRASTTPSP